MIDGFDLQQFVQRFHLLAEAQGGTSTLRGLVLDLAIRGKLTTGADTSRTPDRQLRAAGAFDLPAGWSWKTIGDLCLDSFYGPRFAKSDYVANGGIPTIRTTDMTDRGEIVLRDAPQVKVDPKKLALYRVEKNDLLITRSGSIGVMAIFRGDYEAIPSAYLIRFRFSPLILVEYVYAFFGAPYGQRLLGLGSTQVGVPNVNATAIRRMPIPVPPIEEQKRIVERVDELMRLIDELEAAQTQKLAVQTRLRISAVDALARAEGPEELALAWKRVAGNFEVLFDRAEGVASLRVALRTLAVQGRLLPQVPADGRGQDALRAMRAHRSEAVLARHVRGSPVSPVTEQERLFTIPDSWAWARFGEVGDWGAGATPSRGRSDYYGGKTPWLKSGELSDGVVTASEEHVTEKALAECSLRVNQPGDVLVAMYGATIGKTALLTTVATTNQAVCACTPFPGLASEYLLLVLQAYRPIFVRQGAGGAQPNISKEKIVATPFPLPPPGEQRRIVARVDALMKLCDDLETKLTAQRTTAAKLAEALVRELVA